MALKSRRRGARNWARGMFAFLWIVLAGFSGLYLFTLFTDPAALGSPTVQLSAMVTGQQAPTPPAALAPAPAAPSGGSQLTPAQFAELKASLQALSQQTAAIDARLKPIEKFIGPVAALPPASSVTTSPPAPIVPLPEETSAPLAPEPQVAVAEVEETVIEAPAEPAASPPAETPAAVSPPLPPAVAAAPEMAAPPAAAGAPMEEEAQPASESPEPAPEAAAPAAAAEIASLDPVALPPAANDGSTRYGIEIGVVTKRDELRPLWREYLANHAALVAGLQPRRVLAPDKKWRLIAGPFANAQDAEGACTLFKKADRPCAATVYAGDSL